MKAIEINIRDMIAKKYESLFGPRIDGDKVAYDLFCLGFHSGFNQGIRTAASIVSEKQLSFNFILI